MNKTIQVAVFALCMTSSLSSAQYGGAGGHGGAGGSEGGGTFYGTDTLWVFMNHLIDTLETRGDFQPGDIAYGGGGSTYGQNGLVANTQELAPMSRFLNTQGCASAPLGAGCWRVGKDLLAVIGNDGQACDSLAWSDYAAPVSLTVDPLANGNTTLECPNCTGTGGDQYTFSDWRTVLRVLYAGQHGTGSGTTPNKICTSDVRATLVRSWTNLFKDGCATGACASGLRHAYRGDDMSGTNDSFLELLQLQVASSTPFCNGTERQDSDPIRRECDGNGFNGAGEEVCRRHTASTVGNGYNLGLVLPVLIPQVDPYGAANGAPFDQNCGVATLGGAAAGPVAWTLNDVTNYGSTCPNGTPQVGGTCLFPRRAGAPAGTGFGCIASRNDRPAGSASSVDARIYNLWARNNDGSVKTYLRGATATRANVSYFRNHQKQCTQIDATDQIACFVSDDACSIGFASVSGLSTSTDTIGVGLKSVVPFDHDADPLTPNQFATVYPVDEDFDYYGFARFFWVCTRDNFANTGTQPTPFVDAQLRIRDALTDTTPVEVADAMNAAGFLSFPSTDPLVYQYCPGLAP